MQVISHRGVHSDLPENSLASFEEALQHGIDGIELDIRLTVDGACIVYHDDLINVGGKMQYVQDVTWEDAKSVDLGGGHRIPLLKDVLDKLAGSCPMILDLKSYGIADKLLKVLEPFDVKGLHVTSFIHREILSVARQRPDFPRSLTFRSIPVRFDQILQNSMTNEVSLFRGYVTEPIVKELKSLGAGVRSYTVNLLNEAEKFSDWGVDAIYTDYPDQMQSLREGKKDEK